MPVAWSGSPSTDIVIITERERQDPVATLMEQLRRLGYGVHVAPRASYQFINRLPTPQIVLLDISSRDFISSGTLPTTIQSAWENVPVILLARAEELPRMRFSPGLLDFISLPVNQHELDARLRFTLWRVQGTRAPREHLQLEGLRLNLATYEVWIENRKIDLTYREFELLRFFVTNRRRVFSRAELLEEVWENDYFGGTRTVDVHIRRLRAKLGPKLGDMIQTVRNVGYRFG